MKTLNFPFKRSIKILVTAFVLVTVVAEAKRIYFDGFYKRFDALEDCLLIQKNWKENLSQKEMFADMNNFMAPYKGTISYFGKKSYMNDYVSYYLQPKNKKEHATKAGLIELEKLFQNRLWSSEYFNAHEKYESNYFHDPVHWLSPSISISHGFYRLDFSVNNGLYGMNNFNDLKYPPNHLRILMDQTKLDFVKTERRNIIELIYTLDQRTIAHKILRLPYYAEVYMRLTGEIHDNDLFDIELGVMSCSQPSWSAGFKNEHSNYEERHNDRRQLNR